MIRSTVLLMGALGERNQQVRIHDRGFGMRPEKDIRFHLPGGRDRLFRGPRQAGVTEP
jgi:hypothetical protein